jgi:hypothetical protein
VTDIEFASEITNPAAYPQLSDAQIARLRSFGTPQTVQAGEVSMVPAVGSVRHGSVKRVVAGGRRGRGASAVRSVHTPIGVHV